AKLREGIGESGESLKSAQDRLSALSEHIAAAHSRSEAYDREIAAFAEQRSELLARRDALTSAVQAAEAQKVAKEQSLAQFDSAFARSHNEREQIKSAIAGLRTDRNAKEKELAAERRAAQDLAAR